MTAPTDEELRKLALAATPGPYVVVRFDNEGGAIDYQVETEITQQSIDNDEHAFLAHFGEYGNPKRNKRDAEYYAAANPARILRLLDQLEAARGALDFYAKGLGEQADDYDIHVCTGTLDDEEIGYEVAVPGKRARTALAHLEGKA